MANLLGDWNFLQYWWWKPYLDPLAGLAWFAGVIVLGALLFFVLTGSARLSEYRLALLPPKEPDIPADEAALVEFMESFFPEVSEEEILLMERTLDDVMKEEVHPEAAREIKARGIAIRLLSLPLPETARAAGSYPAAAWIPRLNAIEIYGSILKRECGGDIGRYKEKIGESLLREITRALGADEAKIRNSGAWPLSSF